MSGVFQNIDPHPLTARRVCPPPWGWGEAIFCKTPDTACSVLYIRKYFVPLQVEDPRVAPSPQDCGYYPPPPGNEKFCYQSSAVFFPFSYHWLI
jgi:hypothetical protein